MEAETKALSDIGKAAVKRAFSFLEVLLIPPCQEVGLLAQDQVRYWRFKNQIRILNKAQDFLQKNDVSPTKVSLKTLVPLLEYGSLEEDQTMQEKWAALLAKAANPKYSYDPIVAYIEILKQLSPLEAKVLDLMFDFHAFEFQRSIDSEVRDDEIMKKTNMSQADYYILLSNLLRLNVIEELSNSTGLTTNVPKFHTVKGSTELTDIGYRFVRHCKIDLYSKIQTLTGSGGPASPGA